MIRHKHQSSCNWLKHKKYSFKSHVPARVMWTSLCSHGNIIMASQKAEYNSVNSHNERYQSDVMWTNIILSYYQFDKKRFSERNRNLPRNNLIYFIYPSIYFFSHLILKIAIILRLLKLRISVHGTPCSWKFIPILDMRFHHCLTHSLWPQNHIIWSI